MSGYRFPWEDPGRRGSISPEGTLVANESSSEESTPLLPGKTQRRMPRKAFELIIGSLIALSGLLFITVNLYMHFANCPLYPSTMNEIRRGWEKEAALHDIKQETWRLEEQEHAVLDEEWKLQTEWHNKEVARRKRAEEERQEMVRKEWVKEVEIHRREWEEMERRENQRQENEREQWRHKVEDHDRIEEERRKHEEEERQKLNMFWDRVEPHACTTFATRGYTAQLMNLPLTWEHRVEACKATPLEVKGISYLPKGCEDKGPGVVIGRWEISNNEADCRSFWLYYKDKESLLSLPLLDRCTAPGSGKRRIEQYLENLPRGGDWREFCATTPAHFNGMAFSGAEECFQSNGGTWGHWEVDDPSCQ